MSDTWDDERIATLTKMWAEGHSSTRIAMALGLTRNAIIGKVTRLKLPEPSFKLPVIIDRTYVSRLPEVRREKVRAYERVYKKARKERLRASMETKREVREGFLARGATPTSAAYRKHLPPLPDMTKGELRAMLTQAIQNTAAL
jgi:hypothetical protein